MRANPSPETPRVLPEVVPDRRELCREDFICLVQACTEGLVSQDIGLEALLDRATWTLQ